MRQGVRHPRRFAPAALLRARRRRSEDIHRLLASARTDFLPQAVLIGEIVPLLSSHNVDSRVSPFPDTSNVVMAGYTGLAAQLARFWREPRHLAMANRVLGLLFVAAAVLLAVYRRGG